MQSSVTTANSAEVQLLSLRMGGTKPPLFCLPGGLGELVEFDEMAALMPEDQTIYGIRTVEFQTQENITISRLASVCIQSVQKKQAHGPYCLLGYSLGGLVAYEMAVQLVNGGEKIGLLALFDTPYPHHVPMLSFPDSVKHYVTYLISRMNKYWRNLRLGKIDSVTVGIRVFVRHKLQQTIAFSIRRLFRMLNLPVPEQTRSWKAMDDAVRGYVAPTYANRLVLFRAKDGESKYDESLTLGWERCALGVIDVHFVPGDHWGIITHPRAVAEKLTEYLQAKTENNIHE